MVALDVVNAGREVAVTALQPSPVFRCRDASSYRLAGYTRIGELGWIARHGTFRLRDAGDDRLVTLRGSFRGSEASGVMRIVELFRDGRGACDSGEVVFAVRGP